jgi:hypothetical protein
MSTSLIAAQWLTYRDPRLPRTREGQPNLSAPAPRSNGHPDLSGVWQVEATATPEIPKLFGDLGRQRSGDQPFSDSNTSDLLSTSRQTHRRCNQKQIFQRGQNRR